MAVGLFITADFGVSWDEVADAAYGHEALQAYSRPGVDWQAYGKRKYYGPAYFMLQDLASRALIRFVPEWGVTEARHYVNFIAFQLGVAAFYVLVRRLVGRKGAFISTLLFAFQPLYFGHAFINGKDVPFMAAFLLALAFGVESANRLQASGAGNPTQSTGSGDSLMSAMRQDYAASSLLSRVALPALALICALVVFDLYVTRWLFQPFLERVVQDAYLGRSWQWANRLFDAVAQHSSTLPPQAYVAKAVRLLERARLYVFLTVIALLLSVWIKVFPRSRRLLWTDLRPSLSRDWVSPRFLLLLLLGGISAGVAISIRVVGLLCVLLVSIVYLAEHRGRAWAPLLLYGGLAVGTACATWPFLWSDPWHNFVESVRFMLSNPNRDYVLFMGEVMKGRLLPRDFVPVLIGLQFTEPLWLLSALGLLALAKRQGRTLRWHMALFMGAWVLLPVLPFMIRETWYYDNFRQFLFITPPFFMLAAIGLDFLLRSVRRRAVQWLLVALILVPGIAEIVRLHPYEYVYYNRLAGGTRGAARKFELDYWATSYTQAIKLLNGMLPVGSVVAFWGTEDGGITYARHDLVITRFREDKAVQDVAPDVVVVSTRANMDLLVLPTAPVLAEITIEGAPLAVIKIADEP